MHVAIQFLEGCMRCEIDLVEDSKNGNPESKKVD